MRVCKPDFVIKPTIGKKAEQERASQVNTQTLNTPPKQNPLSVLVTTLLSPDRAIAHRPPFGAS